MQPRVPDESCPYDKLHGIDGLVMTATGTPWDNQLNDEILQPLSMHNTTLRPSRGQVERMPPNKPVDEFVLKFQKPM